MLTHLQLLSPLLFVLVHDLDCSPICPPQNNTDSPRFTQVLGSLDYVRYDHYIAVLCCAEGYGNISWYRLQGGTWVTFPGASLHGDYNVPDVAEQGQVLQIKSAKFEDETTYRCDLEKDSEVVLSHKTDLRVVDCDKMARGPIPTDPHPENQTIYEYGGNVTLYCSGYFGCMDPGDSDENIVMWRVDGIWNRNIQNISTRYKVRNDISHDGAIKKATLTISNVQESDTQRTFVCELLSPQVVHGQTSTPVFIVKKDKPKPPWLVIGLSVGGGVVFILIVIIVILVLRNMYGPRIRLFVYSRLPSVCQKVIDAEAVGLIYHLYIHHVEDDENRAQSLKEELTKAGYVVAITADIKAGTEHLTEIGNISRQSACVFVIFSENFMEDERADMTIKALVTDRSGRNITFLEIKKYEAKVVMERVINARDVETDMQDVMQENPNGQVATEASTASVQERDGEHENINDDSALKREFNDLDYWKVLPRIKVPTEDASARQKTNFLCRLQNKIPKFKSQGKKDKDINTRERNSSSGRPLLESQGDCGHECPVNNLRTPNSENDAVFEYENGASAVASSGSEGNDDIQVFNELERTVPNRSTHTNEINTECADTVFHMSGEELPSSGSSGYQRASPFRGMDFESSAEGFRSSENTLVLNNTLGNKNSNDLVNSSDSGYCTVSPSERQTQ